MSNRPFAGGTGREGATARLRATSDWPRGAQRPCTRRIVRERNTCPRLGAGANNQSYPPRYDLDVRCAYPLADGSVCNRAASILDARHGRMLCRAHAVLPLERTFGPRPDLEDKAEYALRFLALPSAARHEILEALSAEDRREFVSMAMMFAADDDR